MVMFAEVTISPEEYLTSRGVEPSSIHSLMTIDIIFDSSIAIEIESFPDSSNIIPSETLSNEISPGSESELPTLVNTHSKVNVSEISTIEGIWVHDEIWINGCGLVSSMYKSEICPGDQSTEDTEILILSRLISGKGISNRRFLMP